MEPINQRGYSEPKIATPSGAFGRRSAASPGGIRSEPHRYCRTHVPLEDPLSPVREHHHDRTGVSRGPLPRLRPPFGRISDSGRDAGQRRDWVCYRASIFKVSGEPLRDGHSQSDGNPRRRTPADPGGEGGAGGHLHSRRRGRRPGGPSSFRIGGARSRRVEPYRRIAIRREEHRGNPRRYAPRGPEQHGLQGHRDPRGGRKGRCGRHGDGYRGGDHRSACDGGGRGERSLDPATRRACVSVGKGYYRGVDRGGCYRRPWG